MKVRPSCANPALWFLSLAWDLGQSEANPGCSEPSTQASPSQKRLCPFSSSHPRICSLSSGRSSFILQTRLWPSAGVVAAQLELTVSPGELTGWRESQVNKLGTEVKPSFASRRAQVTALCSSPPSLWNSLSSPAPLPCPRPVLRLSSLPSSPLFLPFSRTSEALRDLSRERQQQRVGRSIRCCSGLRPDSARSGPESRCLTCRTRTVPTSQFPENQETFVVPVRGPMLYRPGPGLAASLP